MKRIKRPRWSFLIAFALVLIGIYYGGSALVSPLIRQRLQAMVSAHLNAELRMDHVRYHFPYGVSITNAVLLSQGPDGQPVELFKVEKLVLSLAKIPWGHGPLVIEKLILTNPSIHVIHTAQGTVGEHGLVKPDESGAISGSVGGENPNVKISEMFHLRRLKIDGGQVIYEDRTKAHVVPVVWKDLQIDLNTTPQSGAIYRYNIVARNLPLADAAASGTMDIDELNLNVRNFALKLQVSSGARQSQLPAALQDLLRAHQINGKLVLSGNADVPLRTPAQTQYDATIDLPNASGQVAKWDASLDRMVIKVRCSSTPPSGMDLPPLDAAAVPDVLEKQNMVTRAMAAYFTLAISPEIQQASTTAPFQGIPTTRAAPPLYVTIEKFEAGSGDTLLQVVEGSAVIDPVEGVWRVRRMSGTLVIGANHSALPTQLQSLFNQLAVSGKMIFTAAASGPIKPDVAGGRRAIDQIHYSVCAYPRDLSLRPHGFPLAIEKLAGEIDLVPGVVSLRNFEAAYGTDRIFVTDCQLPLDRINDEMRIEGMAGSIDFGKEAVPYPAPLDKIFEAVRPGGTYFVSGDCIVHQDLSTAIARVVRDAADSAEDAAEPPPKVDYQLDITGDGAAASVGPRHIPLTGVKCDISAATSLIDVKQFSAAAFGGTVSGTAQIKTGRVIAYNARGSAGAVDLKKFAECWAGPGETPIHLSGRGYANVVISGTGPRQERTLADNFTAKGELEILEGDFWQVPVIKDIIDNAKVARDALTVGQAAGTFEVYDQTVSLTNAAISAPVLGLQGSGTVRFDGQIDASVIAAPLADWKDQMHQLNIPLVSEAAGAIAGGVQKLLNSATRNLLYEFRISGTVAHPNTSVVPAPMLSDAAAAIFGKMLNPSNHDRLIDDVKQKK